MNYLFKQTVKYNAIINKASSTFKNAFKFGGKINISKILFGTLFGYFIFQKQKNTFECIQQSQNSNTKQKISQNVQIYILNKPQLINELNSIEEQSILISFNKYFKNEKKKQFQQKLSKIYNQAKRLNIQKIYLIDKNHIKQLLSFQKLLDEGHDNNKQKNITQQTGQNHQEEYNHKSKQFEYYYLTPNFPNKSFKLDNQNQISKEINEIRIFKVEINPSIEEIFYNYTKIFNRTTIIKQCPQYVPNLKENKCLQEFKNNITTLLQQKMLRNKQDQYRFYAILPNSKKDISSLIDFKKQLLNSKQQQKQNNEYVNVTLSEGLNQKQQDMIILRNDMLGKSLQSFKQWKKSHYQLGRKLTDYEKFLLFMKPRVFIISKTNFSVDLYWYITCINRNKQLSLSINNTDQFNLGHSYSITNGKQYPKNSHLQFLKILYKNHPQFNYVVVNTNTVSQLIRHLFIKNKYVIFNLTNQISYPKMFFPNLNQNLTPQNDYNINFKQKIQLFTKNPHQQFDQIVMEKQKKIDKKNLQCLIDSNKQKQFILRVCNLKCQNDLSQQKLENAFYKILGDKMQRSSFWQNYVYRKTYWIDSYFNNIQLKEGDYIYLKNKFEPL